MFWENNKLHKIDQEQSYMSVEARDTCNGHDLKKNFVELVKARHPSEGNHSTLIFGKEICLPFAKSVNGI
jgi:hypothetical protein